MFNKGEYGKLYRPIPTILIVVGIYFVAQIVASILISILPVIYHINVDQAEAWLNSNVWATFLFVLLIESVTLGLLYYFLLFRKLNFISLGLNKLKSKYIPVALIGFAAYFVIYILGLVIAKVVFPSLNLEQKQELGFDTATQGWSLIPVFISLVVLPPIVEEIVARGFLFGGLRTKLNFVYAAMVTSIIFAIAHIGDASDGLLWVAAIDTFILSLVLCYLREKTGSLWPSIYVHMLKNGLAFVILFNIAGYIR